MERREFLRMLAAGAASAMLPGCMSFAKNESLGKRPNFLVIFVDDLGYNDLGSYEAKDSGIKTPDIDRMAAEGVKFTDWFSACCACAPSRAALLTGRYPNRCGVPVCPNGPSVFEGWYENIGLQQSEITIAEILKERGYATAWYGKSHLGHNPKFLPLRHGFDEYYGSIYNFPVGGGCPVYEGDDIVAQDVRYETIHEKLTQRTSDFMKKSKKAGKPFFIYLAHYLVHGPWVPNRRIATDEEWASYEELQGNMNAKVYPAMVRELDWHVGQVLKSLKQQGLDEDTLVLFTSDNGPWHPAGSAWPLRGCKFNTFEGGHRVPSIARWPGKIPAGLVCDELATTMDYFPTIAYLADARLPKDRIIDGRNIWPLMSGQKGTKSPHEVLFYYNGTFLEVVREGKWKLHLPRKQEMRVYWTRGKLGGWHELHKPVLFNLADDVEEKNDVADKYPQVVKRLLAHAEKARAELGDWNHKGRDQKKLLDYTGNPNKPTRIKRKASSR